MRQRQPNDAPAIHVETDTGWAWRGDERLELTPKAFAVLHHLVKHPERLVTKDELMSAVWGDTVVSEAALTSAIRDLRAALADSARAPRFIETVHRRGFRFIGRVATSSAAVRPPATRPDAAVGSAASRPLLVGREPELARLNAAFGAALTGRRRLVFVTGEAGIGKTALVERFVGQLQADGHVRIGRGQCVEQYGAGEAYLPVLEALGRMGRESQGDELVRVLRQYAPTWLVQLPALLADDDVEAVQRRAQGATRERMLREWIEAFDALSRETPLVLLLEDLHWSDSATVGLLAMLARRPDPARALILATYRPAEVAAGHPLAAATRELGVHGQSEEVALGLLTAAAVQEYLDGRFPHASFPSRLARVLHRNTSGNPLFLVNVVDDLVRQGHVRTVAGRWELTVPLADVAAGVPQTLWQLVEHQIERLTPQEQASLAVGCIAGAEFSAALATTDGTDVHDAERSCANLARRGQLIP
jgi:DNA-binding winged helix-turn-helix (wHTH) protein